MKCVVVENIKGMRPERPLHLIRFVTNEEFEYESGDLLDIAVPEYPLRNRQFSVAGSGTDGKKNNYDFIVRDAGIVGHYLCSLQTGETFDAEYIGGMFHPQSDSIWISSGSGLAPFRDALIRGNSEGSKYFCNIDGEEEKYEITGPEGDAYVVYSYNHQMQREILEQHLDMMKDKQIYVCGSARYVTEICSFLGDRGIDPMYIETDMYGAATD